jgi:hypothetical protein
MRGECSATSQAVASMRENGSILTGMAGGVMMRRGVSR